MTWGNRFRLLAGLVGVVALVAAATFHLNGAQAHVASSSATIAAEAYDVGTPYGGVVIDQLVEVGDAVDEGEALFLVESANLRRDLAQAIVPQRAVAEDVDPDGYLIVRATGAGTVSTVDAETGTFVQESSVLATVQRAGSVYIEAKYLLTPQQYTRIGDQATARVVLPNQAVLTAAVAELVVEQQDSRSLVVVTLRSPELVSAEASDRLVAVGAPVEATLELENDGPVTDAGEAVTGSLKAATTWVTDLFSGGSS